MSPLPVMDQDTIVRDVKLPGHRIQLFETNRVNSMGKPIVAYRLLQGDATVFEGDDYAVGMLTCIDSDDAVRGILSFLTLRPGDVEEEYFDKYTPSQVEWRDQYAEELSLYADDESAEPLRDTWA